MHQIYLAGKGTIGHCTCLKIIRSEGTISFGDMKSKMSLKLFDGIPLRNLRLLSTTQPVESCRKKRHANWKLVCCLQSEELLLVLKLLCPCQTNMESQLSKK